MTVIAIFAFVTPAIGSTGEVACYTAVEVEVVEVFKCARACARAVIGTCLGLVGTHTRCTLVCKALIVCSAYIIDVQKGIDRTDTGYIRVPIILNRVIPCQTYATRMCLRATYLPIERSAICVACQGAVDRIDGRGESVDNLRDKHGIRGDDTFHQSLCEGCSDGLVCRLKSSSIGGERHR